MAVEIDYLLWLDGESIASVTVTPPGAEIAIGNGLTQPDTAASTEPTPPAPSHASGVVTFYVFVAPGQVVVDGDNYEVVVLITTATRSDTCRVVFRAYN